MKVWFLFIKAKKENKKRTLVTSNFVMFGAEIYMVCWMVLPILMAKTLLNSMPLGSVTELRLP